MEELSNYQQWQQNKYGNILPEPEFLPNGEVFENDLEEINRMTEWAAMNLGRMYHEFDNQHTNGE